MTASYAPVDFDHRLVLINDRLFQTVPNSILARAEHGGLRVVAASHDGPLLPQIKLGTGYRRIEWKPVHHTESFAKWNAHRAEDPEEVVASRYDQALPRSELRFQIFGHVAHPRTPAIGVHTRFGP